jgi:hypothetical protein
MDPKIGSFSQRTPVIITEGISGAYFCDADTPECTGWDFASPKGSSFTGLSCHQKGYCLGKVVESWYSTGIPSTTLK